jgi:alpha-glucosidase
MTGRLRESDLNHQVGRRLRASMAAINPETLLIAEHCHDATADLSGDGWYSTMNYAGFTNPICDWLGSWFPPGPQATDPQVLRSIGGALAAATITEFAASISWRSRCSNMTLLGSHDSVRFRSLVGGDRHAHHIGATLLMTMPGTPSVFQGDELGLSGSHSHLSRAPMPWDDETQWDHETLHHYQMLIAARRSSSALRRGGFRWVSIGEDHLTFLREAKKEVILVHADRTGLSPTSVIVDDLLAQFPAARDLVRDVLSHRRGTVSELMERGGVPGAAVIAWRPSPALET